MKELLLLFPEVEEVYQTSDGGVHLKLEEAEVQARHLENPKIKTIKTSKVKK